MRQIKNEFSVWKLQILSEDIFLQIILELIFDHDPSFTLYKLVTTVI